MQNEILQRILCCGWKAGLLTGLGFSAADCFYAAAGAFGLTFISDFLLRYESVIHLLGGGFVCLMGAGLFRNKGEGLQPVGQTGFAGMLLPSFLIGITNPAAILSFLSAFSRIGVPDGMQPLQGGLLVCGVFIGTYLWRGFLVHLTGSIQKRRPSSIFSG